MGGVCCQDGFLGVSLTAQVVATLPASHIAIIYALKGFA